MANGNTDILSPDALQQSILGPILSQGLAQLLQQGTVASVDPLTGRPALAEDAAPRGHLFPEFPFSVAGGFRPGSVGPGTLGTPVNRGALQTASLLSLITNTLSALEAAKRRKRKP